jgi:hypothetical protein
MPSCTKEASFEGLLVGLGLPWTLRRWHQGVLDDWARVALYGRKEIDFEEFFGMAAEVPALDGVRV